MTQDLRDALNHAADQSQPTVYDPSSLWREARRSQRRAQLGAGLSVFSVVVLVVLALVSVNGSDTSAPATPTATAGRAPAVPQTLYEPQGPLERHEGLDIGITAAVFRSDTNGEIAAVSAVDGAYRYLTLPGYDELASLKMLSPALALSPDGSRLAYAWHAGALPEFGSYRRGGVTVVDLVSGQGQTYPVRESGSPSCGALSWSANGRYLVYTCHINPDGGGSRFRAPVQRLDTVTGVQVTVPGLDALSGSAAAVNSDGAVAVPGGETVAVWAPSRGSAVMRVSSAIDITPSYASWLDDGTVVLSGTAPDGISYQVIDVFGGSPEALQAAPGVGGRLVGSVGDDTVSLWTSSPRGASVFTVSRSGTLVKRLTFEGLAPVHEYTIATALLQRPSSNLPAPDWADGRLTRLRAVLPYVIGGVGLLGLTCYFFVALRRRPALADD